MLSYQCCKQMLNLTAATAAPNRYHTVRKCSSIPDVANMKISLPKNPPSVLSLLAVLPKHRILTSSNIHQKRKDHSLRPQKDWWLGSSTASSTLFP